MFLFLKKLCVELTWVLFLFFLMLNNSCALWVMLIIMLGNGDPIEVYKDVLDLMMCCVFTNPVVILPVLFVDCIQIITSVQFFVCYSMRFVSLQSLDTKNFCLSRIG